MALLSLPIFFSGILFARFVKKQAQSTDDDKPLDQAGMESEMGKAERGER